MTIPFKCSDIVRFKIAGTEGNLYRVITVMYNNSDNKWKVMLKGGPDFSLDIGTFDADGLEKCNTTTKTNTTVFSSLPKEEIKYNVWIETTYNNNAPRHSNKLMSKEDLQKLIGRYFMTYDGIDDFKSEGAIKQLDFCKLFTSGNGSYVVTVTLVYWDSVSDEGVQEHLKTKCVVVNNPIPNPPTQIVELHPKMKSFVDVGFLKERKSWR